jgi:Na+/proline symporter
MLEAPVVVAASLFYLGLLFAVAWWGDRRADQGKSIIANPTIYALSMAVYCTTWTFYGSVGRAAVSGIGFLPVYLGPTLVMALGWFVLLKMIRIVKANRITSIADFISSRYGKSHLLGGLVTIIAVVGIIPYIALQLKAMSGTVSLLLSYPEIVMPSRSTTMSVAADMSFYIALILAAFTIVFGTRHLDATERHEGMVAAIALESGVKLVSFFTVGLFVTYSLYDGFGDIFEHMENRPELRHLMTAIPSGQGYTGWFSLIVLSGLAVLFLPRQFQVAVVENVNEAHLKRAAWLFPLYLLLINVFVLPIALGGLLHFSGQGVDADTFVLTLPMSQRHEGLALLVFIGGLSAGTGMVIVETIALSTMVCNDLVMPLLLHHNRQSLEASKDLSGLLLGIRRGAIVGILLLGYLYFRLAGEAYALVAIGLISFSAVAQFAPAMIGGMYWRGGTRGGALAGLSAGFPGLGLHLVVAVVCQVGLASRRLPDAGDIRDRSAAAAATVRPVRSRRNLALPVLEPACQYRRLCRRLAAAATDGRRGDAGDGFRRRTEGYRDAWRRAVARPGEGQRPAATGWTVSRSGACPVGVRCLRASAGSRQTRHARGGCAAGAVRRVTARRCHRQRFGARHGRLGRQGGAAQYRRGHAHPRRGLAAPHLQPRAGAQVARTDCGDARIAGG